ncbi:hypothetical protein V2J09_024018 [Rumex salicifolius]
MPSFPPPGTVTICEINRDLITADSISDDQARESYGKILGAVFRPVSFQPENLTPASNGEAGEQLAGNRESGFAERGFSNFPSKIFSAVNRFFHPNDAHLLPAVNLQGVSWHQHKHILAFISGPNQVTIRDYEDSEGKDPSILDGDFQRDVKLVEWRPNGGVGFAYGQLHTLAMQHLSDLGLLNLGNGIRWTLVDCLKSSSNEHITALSWTSGSYESASFTIWDVSQGVGTPMRRGLGGISILKWSPAGDYFFAAKFDGTFYFWETATWTSESWSSSGGFVIGAIWDPESRQILVSFSESASLGSIHFASKPPSLDAHLLRVDLPEIPSLTGSQKIEKIAWDASGERLAVSYKDGDELYMGLIAVYDVRRTPLISVSLVGFIRGPGENTKPLALSFHNKFKQGPLLSVCWSSGHCCTYPLLFRSHVQPN